MVKTPHPKLPSEARSLSSFPWSTRDYKTECLRNRPAENRSPSIPTAQPDEHPSLLHTLRRG